MADGDNPSLFPPPPGVAPSTEPAPTQHAVDDATGASVGRRSAPAWCVCLPSGQQLLVERTTFIGRDPSRNERWPDAASRVAASQVSFDERVRSQPMGMAYEEEKAGVIVQMANSLRSSRTSRARSNPRE